VEETIAFAREWAAELRPNDIVALSGDLGTGKTHFVKGLVAGCGSDESVTSPTFTLLHEYRDGRMPIFHFDFYRIERREELERLGFEDYLQESGVVVVEWADRFPDLLPDRTRWLRIAAGNNNERFISEGE
jgi:tRNA threonylcarbamoyladenosine biosynthesis protein TsaE